MNKLYRNYYFNAVFLHSSKHKNCFTSRICISIVKNLNVLEQRQEIFYGQVHGCFHISAKRIFPEEERSPVTRKVV